MYSSVVDRFHMIYMQNLIKYWSLDAIQIPLNHSSYCCQHCKTFNLDVHGAYKPIGAEFQLCCFSLWTGFIHVVSQALCVNLHDLRISGPELQIPCSSGIFMVEVAARDSASLSPVLPNHCCHKLWYILSPELIAHVVFSQLWFISANIASSRRVLPLL